MRARLYRGWRALGTLRVRLTLWYVALLALILVAFSAFLYLSLDRTLDREIERSLEAQARRLTAPLEAFGAPPQPDGRGALPRFRPPIAGTVVALYGPTGDDLLFGDSWGGLPVLAAARGIAAAGVRDVRTIVLDDGEPWRVLTRPVDRDGRRLAVVQVARSEGDAQATLGHLLVGMALAIPLTLLLAVAVGLFLAGRALDPIDRITRTADQIGAENLSRRLDLPPSADEVGRLAATFDRMLDRLDRAFRRQRQFTADASHELRTPLAMLISQAEVALGRRRTASEYQRVLAGVRDDARRMDQLLGELLTLARADAGQELLMREPLDLGDLTTDVVAAMEPLARARGVELRLGSIEAVEIQADQTRLTQLLVNLIDNGLKYTPAGGTVTVSVERQDGTAVTQVADGGVGIASEHLPHVFERFYRVDAARTRAEGGAGLGLTIGRWIAEAHGGTIRAESELGRGSTFTVHLPLVTEDLSTNGSPPGHGSQRALPATGRVPGGSSDSAEGARAPF